MPRGMLIGALLALQPAPAMAQDAPQVTIEQVKIDQGTLVGARDEHGIATFEAVPYAAPPVGALRWRPPAPPLGWTGPRDATRPGPSCPQNDYRWNHGDVARASEDCLTLSIASPDLTGHLPVMVWIHGGSNRAGSSLGAVHAALTRRGVVLVAIQYRLGVLGFLAHRAAAAEAGGHAGNYGLMDQIAALHWVQAHIAQFGGDPAQVTIFGESAGAQDVGQMLASPQTTGLFARAIAQSGTPSFGLPWRPLPEAFAIGDQLDRLLGGDGTLAPLRRAAVADLLKADLALHDPVLQSDDLLWLRTTIDGVVLPDTPARLLSHAPPRPVIIGSNHAEFGLPGGATHREASVRQAFGREWQRAWAHYRLDLPDPDWSADPRGGGRDLQLATDILFRCPAGQFASIIAQTGAAVWRYEFDAARGGGISYHAAEIPYVFDGDPLTVGGLRLQDYWVAFARTGDPDGALSDAAGSRPAWPRFNATRAHLAIGPQSAQARGPLAAIPCDWMAHP